MADFDPKQVSVWLAIGTTLVGAIFGAGGVWVKMRVRLARLEDDMTKTEATLKEARAWQEAKFQDVRDLLLTHERDLRTLIEGKARSETSIDYIKDKIVEISDSIKDLRSK